MLPGGVANPDFLRTNEDAVRFTRAFFEAGKPVAAICHAPWTLVEADVVQGRTLTSWPSLKTDIENAGGTWVDEEVHVDSGLVTSRKPDDLPAFCDKLAEEICEGRHENRPSRPREPAPGSSSAPTRGPRPASRRPSGRLDVVSDAPTRVVRPRSRKCVG